MCLFWLYPSLTGYPEGTQSKAPTMSEMKESGDIEQDADAIILMYNPRDEEDQAESDYMIVRLLIDKNRQGRSKIPQDRYRLCRC